MQIEFSRDVALLLETLAVQSGNREFSGLGFVEWRKETTTFFVYEFIPLDVGSTGWTEIPSAKLVPLYERSDVGNLKLWVHRHPLGNGIPGPQNWSGTDERTCRFEPLGVPYGMQDQVKWSVSAVRTPRGWVGRYDTYGLKGRTVHIPVVPSLGQQISVWVDEIRAVKMEAARAEDAKRRADTLSQLRRVVPFVRRTSRYRQEPMFNDMDEEQFLDDWEAYLSEGGEEEELAQFIQQYFWGEGD